MQDILSSESTDINNNPTEEDINTNRQENYENKPDQFAEKMANLIVDQEDDDYMNMFEYITGNFDNINEFNAEGNQHINVLEQKKAKFEEGIKKMINEKQKYMDDIQKKYTPEDYNEQGELQKEEKGGLTWDILVEGVNSIFATVTGY